jgi:hypothetical protein
LLDAVTDLADSEWASPAGVAAFLGVAQWYDLLRRLQLSVFERVYDFCSGAKATVCSLQIIPNGVMQELLLDVILSAFGTVDMRLPFLPLLGATDASSSFGHGATVTTMHTTELRAIARRSCTAGAHVRLEDGPVLSEALDQRLGPRHDLGLSLKDFNVVLSVRIETPDHINLEEARALLQYVKWILRSRKRFCHRIVVLLDSKVVIGAVCKGRSSSIPLNRILRQLASLCFAGGLVLHCIFIPTSHNPADWPSRGGPSSWPAALRQAGPPNFERLVERMMDKHELGYLRKSLVRHLVD